MSVSCQSSTISAIHRFFTSKTLLFSLFSGFFHLTFFIVISLATMVISLSQYFLASCR